MPPTNLKCLPCIDSDDRAATVRKIRLHVDRDFARELGRSAVDAIAAGQYEAPSGRLVDWSEQVARARSLRRSIRPADQVNRDVHRPHESTTVQVVNATTLQATCGLVSQGEQPLALNFANGISPGGGFLNGARVEEVL